MTLCDNLRNTFTRMQNKESYNGVKSGILQACLGEASKIRPASKLLDVHIDVLFSLPCKTFLFQLNKKSLEAAKTAKHNWMDLEKYVSIVEKVQIRRSKKPLQFKNEIITWILDHTRPTSNTKNIVKCKQEGTKVEHIVHWRESSITKLFQACKLDIQNGEWLHRSYFYQMIPKYVKMVKKKDGLCPMHMTARNWMDELKRLRKKWHFPKNKKCICTCAFCSSNGCNHGKNPATGSCFDFTCECCKDDICKMEWNENINTIWYTTHLVKRAGGGMHWIDEEHQGT